MSLIKLCHTLKDSKSLRNSSRMVHDFGMKNDDEIGHLKTNIHQLSELMENSPEYKKKQK